MKKRVYRCRQFAGIMFLFLGLTFSFSVFGQTSDCADQDFDCRINRATRLIESKPNDPDAYIVRANAYDEKGEFEKAIADYNQALKLEPRSVLAYLNRGLAYSNHGDQSQALADYTKVIELDPKNARAYHDRANIYDDAGKFESALSDYSKAIEIQPDYLLAYLNRAVAYYRQTNWTKALADLNKVIELDAEFAGAYEGRAQIYEKVGEPAKALADRRRFAELQNRTTSAMNRSTNSELRDVQSSIYKPGQTWSYKTRPGEEKSIFIVLKVENHPQLGNIVHIALDNLKMKCRTSADCQVTQAGHLPFAESALTKSAVKMLKENASLPDYRQGYDLWREAFDQNRAGIYTTSIADAVETMEATLN